MSLNNKIRIRTKQELESRKEKFLEICKILDDLKIFYFIQGGTLLGARREKRFIEWDWDVEISLYDYDFIKNFDDIIKSLRLNKFHIVKSDKYLTQKIDCYKEYSQEVSTFTLLSWSYSKKNKNYYRSKINIPEHFLDKYEEIFFYEKKFFTPYPIDDYLSYQYGDWKIRKRTSNKEKYMTKKFFKRDNLIVKINKYIFNKLLELIPSELKRLAKFLLKFFIRDKTIKNFFKIIFFRYFVLRLIYRIFYQPSYKTFNLFTNFQRFKNTLWVEWHNKQFNTWAIKKNKIIFDQANNFYSSFYLEKKIKLKSLPISGGDKKAIEGGGGNETLLYFLTRLIGAKNVLETGVSAGASTRSILEALKLNNQGKLYSSDLATVLKKSQVGILVKEDLKKNWYLYEKGDEKNLPLIFQKEKKFDLVYYDSVKSYQAKKWFHSIIIKNINPKIIIYDDIERDNFFSECISLYNYDYQIFNNAGVIYCDKTIINKL